MVVPSGRVSYEEEEGDGEQERETGRRRRGEGDGEKETGRKERGKATFVLAKHTVHSTQHTSQHTVMSVSSFSPPLT